MMTSAQAEKMTLDQVRAWILHHERMGAKFSKMLQQMVGEAPPMGAAFGSCGCGGSCGGTGCCYGAGPFFAGDPNFGVTRVSGGGGGGFRGGAMSRVMGGGVPMGGFPRANIQINLRRFRDGGFWGGWGWPWWSGWSGWPAYYPLYYPYSSSCGDATAQSLLRASASSLLPIDAVATALGLPLWCPAVIEAKRIAGG